MPVERGRHLAGPGARTPGGPTVASRRHPTGRRRGLASDQESILDLQGLAGNGAVAAALGRVRSGGNVVASAHAVSADLHAAAPEDGIQSIRAKAGGRGLLGLTIRGIEDSPPLFRAEPPVKSGDGYTAKARPVRQPPEPILEEYWPTKGRHKVADGTFIEVSDEWERKLRLGEDEHASDANLAVELTWKKVAAVINQLARQPGPVESSADAATNALWKRYLQALPADLRPDTATPSESAQRDVLAVRGGTFFGWMWESTVVRDTRGYHEPRTKGKATAGDVVVNEIVPADSKLPGPTSEELLTELRKKYTPGRKIIGSKLP